MKNIEYVNFNQFEDKFGNLKEEFEVIKYIKLSNNEWVEDERLESGRRYYKLDDRLYFRNNNTLISLNMDFDSKTCGACYQIGKSIENKRKITNNEILFTVDSMERRHLSLHKQSYSDGTCYYTLQDEHGRWNLNYGSKDINDLITQIQHEIEITLSSDYISEEVVKWQNEVLNNLRLVA